MVAISLRKRGLKKMKQNATISAKKNKFGYYELSITLEGFDNVSIKVNDFGGTQKKTAQKLTYAIAKKLGA